MLKIINCKEYLSTFSFDDLSTSVSDGKYKVKHQIGSWDKNNDYIKEEFITNSSIEVRDGLICYKDLLNACIELTHAQWRSHTFIEDIKFRDNYFRVFLGT